MFCSNCGCEFAKDTEVCNNCGFVIKKRSKAPLIACCSCAGCSKIILLIVAILIVVGVVVFSLDEDEDTKQSEKVKVEQKVQTKVEKRENSTKNTGKNKRQGLMDMSSSDFLPDTPANTANINSMIINGAIQQYETAVKNKNEFEICMNAGMVTELYKQSGDKTNYAKWKKISDSKCNNVKDGEAQFTNNITRMVQSLIGEIAKSEQ